MYTEVRQDCYTKDKSNEVTLKSGFLTINRFDLRISKRKNEYYKNIKTLNPGKKVIPFIEEVTEGPITYRNRMEGLDDTKVYLREKRVFIRGWGCEIFVIE